MGINKSSLGCKHCLTQDCLGGNEATWIYSMTNLNAIITSLHGWMTSSSIIKNCYMSRSQNFDKWTMMLSNIRKYGCFRFRKYGEIIYCLNNGTQLYWHSCHFTLESMKGKVKTINIGPWHSESVSTRLGSVLDV